MDKREALLGKLFLSFRVSLVFPKSEFPRHYLQQLGLDWNKIPIGFNSGQFHHRTTDTFKQPYIEHGILKKSQSANVRSPGLIPYKCFGSYGLIFPLKNEQGEICNFFAKRIRLEHKKEEYLNNDGLYPNYPSLLTKRIFLLPNVIDTASFLQAEIPDKKEAVLALRDGEMLNQHHDVLESLPHLQDVITIK